MMLATAASDVDKFMNNIATDYSTLVKTRETAMMKTKPLTQQSKINLLDSLKI